MQSNIFSDEERNGLKVFTLNIRNNIFLWWNNENDNIHPVFVLDQRVRCMVDRSSLPRREAIHAWPGRHQRWYKEVEDGNIFDV